MPVGGEAMGSALSGFFGADKLKRIAYDDSLRDTQTGQAAALGKLRETAGRVGQTYEDRITAALPQALTIANQNIGTLGELGEQYKGFDPTSTYERIRGGNIASLADQFVNLASQGERGDKLALASMGYGGRGPGAYESILRSDRISRNIAPVLNTIFGNLGRDTAGLNQDRLANLAATMAIMRERQGLPASTAGLALLPYQAQAAMLGDEIGMGGDLAGAVEANTAGFQSKKNKWANFFQQSGRALDQAADAYISMYGGGMMGGGGGAGKGAAGATGGAGTRMTFGDPMNAAQNYNYSGAMSQAAGRLN